MERVVKIGEHEIKLKATAASLIRYKQYFHRDGMVDMLKMANISNDNFTDLDLEVLYNFLWVFAKTADDKIKPLINWLDDFDTVTPIEFITEALTPVVELLTGTVKTSIKKK